MGIKAIYQEGVFKPLDEVKDIKEGEEIETDIGRHEWNKLAMSNPSFDFLKEEQDIYTEADINRDGDTLDNILHPWKPIYNMVKKTVNKTRSGSYNNSVDNK